MQCNITIAFKFRIIFAHDGKSYFYHIECLVDLGRNVKKYFEGDNAAEDYFFPAEMILRNLYYQRRRTEDKFMRPWKKLILLFKQKIFSLCKVALIWLLIITNRTHSPYDLCVELCLEIGFLLFYQEYVIIYSKPLIKIRF